jgi:hypothetical protein
LRRRRTFEAFKEPTLDKCMECVQMSPVDVEAEEPSLRGNYGRFNRMVLYKITSAE